jgi:hypothetical protein
VIDRKVQYAMNKFVHEAPSRFGIEEAIVRQMVALHLRAEKRVTDFFLRNSLSFHEIEVVKLTNGEMYPQWKGATALLVPKCEVMESL